jgi:hypothetical protein
MVVVAHVDHLMANVLQLCRGPPAGRQGGLVDEDQAALKAFVLGQAGQCPFQPPALGVAKPDAEQPGQPQEAESRRRLAAGASAAPSRVDEGLEARPLPPAAPSNCPAARSTW